MFAIQYLIGGLTRTFFGFNLGALALAEIRQYQKTTKLLIPRAPFFRLVCFYFSSFSLSKIPMKFGLGSFGCKFNHPEESQIPG